MTAFGFVFVAAFAAAFLAEAAARASRARAARRAAETGGGAPRPVAVCSSVGAACVALDAAVFLWLVGGGVDVVCAAAAGGWVVADVAALRCAARLPMIAAAAARPGAGAGAALAAAARGAGPLAAALASAWLLAPGHGGAAWWLWGAASFAGAAVVAEAARQAAVFASAGAAGGLDGERLARAAGVAPGRVLASPLVDGGEILGAWKWRVAVAGRRASQEEAAAALARAAWRRADGRAAEAAIPAVAALAAFAFFRVALEKTWFLPSFHPSHHVPALAVVMCALVAEVAWRLVRIPLLARRRSVEAAADAHAARCVGAASARAWLAAEARRGGIPVSAPGRVARLLGAPAALAERAGAIR
jgi:hypothetical protein